VTAAATATAGRPTLLTPQDAGQLARLGVDPSAEAAYRAALERPAWTIEAFAQRMGLARADAVRLADRLAEVDLVRFDAGRTRLWPVSPQLGLTALIARREAELARSWHDLEQGRLAAADLAADFESISRTRLDGAVDVAYGADAARRRVAELVGRATGEVVAMSIPVPGVPDPMTEPRPGDLAGLARGVGFRTVVPDRIRADPLTLRKLAGGGAEVRTASTVPMSALVVDAGVAVFPVAPSRSRGRVGVVSVRLSSVVTTAVELFERVWADAVPLGRATGAQDDEPDDRERELLALLLSGCTDQSAAYKLGISVRTVRRMVADLMERLGARSRFQAGARAAERGWISRQALRGTGTWSELPPGAPRASSLVARPGT
jgi:DNA-binding CsgD family transcriptional regulator